MTVQLDRRLFLTGAAGAGLALAGCDKIAGTSEGQGAFKASEALTYAAQSKLRQGKLAREFPVSDISPYFKPNGSIDPKDPAYKKLAAEKFASFSMNVGGLVTKPRSFTLADLKALPARTQITRHDCVEGWSAIGKWTGPQLSRVLMAAGMSPRARYVVFHCADDLDNSLDGSGRYYESIDLPGAFHPQTILAHTMNDRPLGVAHGAPLRARIERQLGYKQPKYLMRIEVADDLARFGQGRGGYWEDRGYQWYGGI